MLSVVPVAAQTADDWRVAVYPLLGWAPVFGADLPSVPSLPPDGDGTGGGGAVSGGRTDSNLNGALMFGFAAGKGPWRAEADGIWAALHGDRLETPTLSLDLDIVYGHLSGGRRVIKDLYVTAGVRRVALKYDIRLQGLSNFSRKPGLWDPLIGVGWHNEGQTWELHAALEADVFGAGADEDVSAGVRIDWKPIPHFGVAFGYGGIYLKITNTVLGQTFTAEQTLHGPILGVGIYF